VLQLVDQQHRRVAVELDVAGRHFVNSHFNGWRMEDVWLDK
jgi:hypothetical protein